MTEPPVKIKMKIAEPREVVYFVKEASPLKSSVLALLPGVHLRPATSSSSSHMSNSNPPQRLRTRQSVLLQDSLLGYNPPAGSLIKLTE